MTNEQIREGFYKDKYGRWQKDRRQGRDRREHAIGATYSLEHERRRMFRRKVDRQLLEKDHRFMIREALDDFAEEHGGQV
jgi:hypothetical protein